MIILSDRIETVEDLFEEPEVYSCGCMSGILKGNSYIFYKDICNEQFFWYRDLTGRWRGIIFEDVLDDVDDETKEKLLFHLDVFTGNDIEKIWSKGS